MLAIVDMMSIVKDRTEKLTITTLVVSQYFIIFLCWASGSSIIVQNYLEVPSSRPAAFS